MCAPTQFRVGHGIGAGVALSGGARADWAGSA